ncbi:MAG: metallopeptidase family protein [Pirellulales bacterium]|nr:metallopeptidase family protein [Pirellulales bacterium]
MMNSRTRNQFDKILEEVLTAMPPMVHELLDKITLDVEDYPSRQVMEEMDVEYRDDLCGIYTGIPLGEKHLETPPHLSDAVMIYREGIVAATAEEYGRATKAGLREQIRITVLHELAHHHGMTEEELEQLGYG